MTAQRYLVLVHIPFKLRKVKLLHVSGYEKQKSLFVECALLETLCVRSLLTLDKSATVVNHRRCNDGHVLKADGYEGESESKAWRARHKVLGQHS